MAHRVHDGVDEAEEWHDDSYDWDNWLNEFNASSTDNLLPKKYAQDKPLLHNSTSSSRKTFTQTQHNIPQTQHNIPQHNILQTWHNIPSEGAAAHVPVQHPTPAQQPHVSTVLMMICYDKLKKLFALLMTLDSPWVWLTFIGWLPMVLVAVLATSVREFCRNNRMNKLRHRQRQLHQQHQQQQQLRFASLATGTGTF